MDEESGFIQVLKDCPSDNLTRLVYADWLEERGDPRSDYIRFWVEKKKRDEAVYRYDYVSWLKNSAAILPALDDNQKTAIEIVCPGVTCLVFNAKDIEDIQQRLTVGEVTNAVVNNYSEAFNILLEFGAPISEAAVANAVFFNRVEMFNRMMERGAPISETAVAYAKASSNPYYVRRFAEISAGERIGQNSHGNRRVASIPGTDPRGS